jgi:hypothetical protein
MPRAGYRGVRGYQKRAGRKAALQQAALEGTPIRRGPGRPKGSKNKPKPPAAPTVQAADPLEDPGDLLTKIRTTVERTGAPLEEVLALPEIPSSSLDDPAMIARIRDTVERAQLVFRMNVRGALAQKGITSLSVTALLGLARNTPGMEFDQQSLAGADVPEIAGLEIKIDELLERLAKKKGHATRNDLGGTVSSVGDSTATGRAS